MDKTWIPDVLKLLQQNLNMAKEVHHQTDGLTTVIEIQHNFKGIFLKKFKIFEKLYIIIYVRALYEFSKGLPKVLRKRYVFGCHLFQ